MTINDFDEVVSPVMVIVVGNLDFNVNETDSYVFSGLQKIESKLFKIKENFEKPIREMVLVPPLINLQSDFKIYKLPDLKSKNYLLTYRRARDSINCNLS